MSSDGFHFVFFPSPIVLNEPLRLGVQNKPPGMQYSLCTQHRKAFLSSFRVVDYFPSNSHSTLSRLRARTPKRACKPQGSGDRDGGPWRRRAGRGDSPVMAAPAVAAGAAARGQDEDEAAALPSRQALRAGECFVCVHVILFAGLWDVPTPLRPCCEPRLTCLMRPYRVLQDFAYLSYSWCARRPNNS